METPSRSATDPPLLASSQPEEPAKNDDQSSPVTTGKSVLQNLEDKFEELRGTWAKLQGQQGSFLDQLTELSESLQSGGDAWKAAVDEVREAQRKAGNVFSDKAVALQDRRMGCYRDVSKLFKEFSEDSSDFTSRIDRVRQKLSHSTSDKVTEVPIVPEIQPKMTVRGASGDLVLDQPLVFDDTNPDKSRLWKPGEGWSEPCIKNLHGFALLPTNVMYLRQETQIAIKREYRQELHAQFWKTLENEAESEGEAENLPPVEDAVAAVDRLIFFECPCVLRETFRHGPGMLSLSLARRKHFLQGEEGGKCFQ